jgi:hypothetical protein
MNQSLEKRKKFIIKSNERDYNSEINSKFEFSKINNYKCNTFENKGRYTKKIENSNNLIFKKINKAQINSISRKNKINQNNTINDINKSKSKVNVIKKQDSIQFKGLYDNIKYYFGYSSSNKNIGNFRILANNNKYIINNIDLIRIYMDLLVLIMIVEKI